MAKFMCTIGGAIADIGEIKFGFYAPDKAYDNLAEDLGIRKLSGDVVNANDLQGVAFGINSPRPPRVRISYLYRRGRAGTAGNDIFRSTVRYCDPDRVGRVLNGALNGKKINVSGTEYDIKANGVSMYS